MFRLIEPFGGRITGVGSASRGGVFSPLNVSGMFEWFDFSDITTLFTNTTRTTPVTADGNAIGGVTDKSGAGNHLAQATGANKPTYKTAIQNSKSIGRWNGSSTRMDITAFTAKAQPTTYFFVLSVGNPVPVNTRGIMDGVDNSYLQELAHRGSGNVVPARLVMGANANYAQMETQVGLGTAFHVLAVGYNGVTSFIRMDGVTIAIGGVDTNGTRGMYIGTQTFNSLGFFGGDMGEIMAYGSISAADLANIESYLAAKWGVTLAAAPAPYNMSGLTAWFDANNVPYLNGATGDGTIFRWASQNNFPYGADRAAYATPAGERPTLNYNTLNSQSVVSFDGTTDVLVLPATSDLLSLTADTIFIVFRATSITASDGFGSANFLMEWHGTWGILVGNTNQVMRGANANLARVTIAANTWYILETRLEAGTAYLSVNGGTEATTTPGNNPQNADQFLMGGEPHYQGMDVAEFMFFNRALSSGERTTIRNYLNAKWAVY